MVLNFIRGGPVTGRFAPTPSGRMHIGNVYAMLGAWLSARSRGDRMLMRIEDVDKPRVVAGADQLMMDDLHWLGLDWDGEPMFQSQRTERYEYALECLRSQGVLYPCFCSRADIRAASAPNEGDGFMVYPGTCRRLLHDHPDEVRARLVCGDQHSIRIAMPKPAAGEKQRTVPDDSAALSGAVPPEQQGDAGIVDGVACFNDRVYSPQHYDLAREVGDSVIRRADGLFGYQLVVVVDDLDMGVDDIVRGRDLLRSTALQMWIRQCLLAGGFEPECGNTEKPLAEHPEYAHLPLIDNAAGRRLAKRERSLDMGALRARNVTPEQIIGYCAWLLRLQPTPIPCKPADLLADFSWEPLRANHLDRALKPDDPTTPQWLAEALG
ncbi:glutamyl-Q tRNA(Asp) synthetase [Bifidobacterium longum]|uniref:Glutamyl-Q tRNA(Asp) synthetase n=2 Tax=Bifidobacterium longum TaxID=216816 RepID=A0A6A2SXG3_BIFLN|nr:glutamyl-Q tRNA(Asp) synthetase [Bifidobacterium longum]KAB7222481.1 glutamyl-Q tRNA(Asp) synthetase [Bifidobacterium longum]KAB7224841.1 glutamyl-Q tRNA(Asp) synthetase [Bifidobacterium longum]KAB7225406.1 glutamyl-Q tRNA(Asp) synthetase [Bifidobacterium longum]KAB7229481.1 glutamyl-Q tRNA(Asp) synthetase [Bifidobacterium longum]